MIMMGQHVVTLLATFAVGRVAANGCHDAKGNVITGLAEPEERFCTAGQLGDEVPSIPLWKDQDPRTRGPPPYPFPKSRTYNTTGGPVAGKINVHLVPHSHDDTGWQVTVDQYFAHQVFYVIDTVVTELGKDPNRKFIYVETAFFARWWDQANDAKRALATRLVKDRQLEFINGGWCMHDEASPMWTAMVDQTTRGHQFIVKHFGAEFTPRGTWQIDPFGHTNTQAWLLGAEAGMESLFWGRMDWQDRKMRYDKQQGTDGFEWIWQGSASLGKSAQIFAGNLFGTGNGGYGSWFNFEHGGPLDYTSQEVNDDPSREDYNVDQWVDKFVQNARAQANHTLSEHQLWALGSDFLYQNAGTWYGNLDKLIHYVNMNGSVNAFYSTPTAYVEQKKKWRGSFEVRTDDIMPLADAAHDYWSGYFTSRPALKRQVRFATNVLMGARQLEVITKTTTDEVGPAATKHSPPVGDSWTDSFEGTIGVATHHDGMSGTERQDVTDDYEMRISNSQKQVEAGIAIAVGKLLGVPNGTVSHCHCHAADDCLNISMCAATTNRDHLVIAAWNPLGHATLSAIARVPVTGSAWAIEDAFGKVLPSQTLPLDNRTLSLPLLYLNSYNMSAEQVKLAQAELANKADHVLVFEMSLPALGLASFTAKRAPSPAVAQRHTERRGEQSNAQMAHADTIVESDVYALSFDGESGLLKSITNKRSGATTPLSITWGWYNSSVGGCTPNSDDVPPSIWSPPCSDQKSGAYMFRPNSSTFFYPGPPSKPTLEVVRGPVVTEVRQSFSDWATHVIRLFPGRSYVEVEWTAGPIPVDTPWLPPVAFDKKGSPMPNVWGKEVVVRYSSGLKSKGTWYTDSNGKELVRRAYNKRGPSYPQPYNISEPIAGNYYPVNAMMSLDDGEHEIAILTDVSQGGASLSDGELEFMVHRRVQDDDARGVQEPLNETMCGCNDIGAVPGKMGAHGHEGDGGCECAGLTMRGRHLLVFDKIETVHAERRVLSEQLNFPPLLSFVDADVMDTNAKLPSPVSALDSELPPNVKLVSLTSNYASFHDGGLLLRLSHLYAVGEHPQLSQPVEIDLTKIFGKTGLKIVSATETTVSASRPLDGAPRHQWQTHTTNEAAARQLAATSAAAFEEKTPFAFPKLVLRPMEVRTFIAKFA